MREHFRSKTRGVLKEIYAPFMHSEVCFSKKFADVLLLISKEY